MTHMRTGPAQLAWPPSLSAAIFGIRPARGAAFGIHGNLAFRSFLLRGTLRRERRKEVYGRSQIRNAGIRQGQSLPQIRVARLAQLVQRGIPCLQQRLHGDFRHTGNLFQPSRRAASLTFWPLRPMALVS